MKVVKYGLSTVGATSEAYAGVTDWKAPQGIPEVCQHGKFTGHLRRHTTKYFADHQNLEVGGEKEYKDERNHQYQRANGGHSVAKPIRCPACYDEAEYLPCPSAVRETGLPGCRDRPFLSNWVVCAVLLVKFGRCVEAA